MRATTIGARGIATAKQTDLEATPNTTGKTAPHAMQRGPGATPTPSLLPLLQTVLGPKEPARAHIEDPALEALVMRDDASAMLRMGAHELLRTRRAQLDTLGLVEDAKRIARGEAGQADSPMADRYLQAMLELTTVADRWLRARSQQEAVAEANREFSTGSALSVAALQRHETRRKNNLFVQTLTCSSVEELATQLAGLRWHRLESMERSVKPLLPLAAHEALLLVNAMPKEERAAADTFLAPHVCTSLQSYPLDEAIRLFRQLPGPHAPYIMTDAALRLLALKPSLSKRAAESGLRLDVSRGYPDVAFAELAKSAEASPWFCEQTRVGEVPLTAAQSLDAVAQARAQSGEPPEGLHVRFEPNSLAAVPMTELLEAVERSAWLSQNLARAPIALTAAQTKALLELVGTRPLGKELPFVAHAGTIQCVSVSSLLEACERVEGLAPMLRPTPKVVEASEWPREPGEARDLRSRMAPYAVAFAPGASLAPMALSAGGDAVRAHAQQDNIRTIALRQYARTAATEITRWIEDDPNLLSKTNLRTAYRNDSKELTWTHYPTESRVVVLACGNYGSAQDRIKTEASRSLQNAPGRFDDRDVAAAQKVMAPVSFLDVEADIREYFTTRGWRDVVIEKDKVTMSIFRLAPGREDVLQTLLDPARAALIEAYKGAIASAKRERLWETSLDLKLERNTLLSAARTQHFQPEPRLTPDEIDHVLRQAHRSLELTHRDQLEAAIRELASQWGHTRLSEPRWYDNICEVRLYWG